MHRKIIAGMLLTTILASCNSTNELSSVRDEKIKSADVLKTASIQKSKAEVPDYSALTIKKDDIDGNITTTSNPPEAKAKEKSQKASIVKNKPKANEAVLAYEPPKIGTVFTWRNNWANLPTKISYKVSGIKKLGAKEYVIFTSTAGFKNETRAFYDTTNFSLKGYRDSKDKALVTYKPVENRYRFPMKPGDQWLTAWKSIEHKSKEITSGGGVVRVLKAETLSLPAGKFKTLKLKMPVQKNAPRGLTHHVWFAPELGITVKEEIGGGSLNWFQLLEKVEHPKIASK